MIRFISDTFLALRILSQLRLIGKSLDAYLGKNEMLHCKCIILRIHKTIKNDKNDIFKSEIGSANLKKHIKKQYYKSYNKYI